MTPTAGLAAALLAFASIPALAQAAEPHLERVVIVMRHGVRPPTKPADQIADLADKPWPGDAVWGAPPAELTPHGAVAIRTLGVGIAKTYAAEQPSKAVIWGDGADQRTRQTALNMALAFGAPGPGSVEAGKHDPLFSGPPADACPFDAARAKASLPPRTPFDQDQALIAGLTRLQALAAPQGCAGGGGPCLTGPSAIEATDRGLRVTGPVSTGAAIAENLLLEYENDLPPDQLAWGRMQPGDLDTILVAHRASSEVERGTPYVAARRASTLARFVIAALNGATDGPVGPKVSASDKMVVVVGHDTNLANLGGVFGLDWTLPGQPDYTAPGTAMAFERWRDADGRASVRVRIFYQDPDQVRSLSDTPPRSIDVTPAACAKDKPCALEAFTAPAEKLLADACPPKA
jgi:4-phytase/acid phosphatase